MKKAAIAAILLLLSVLSWVVFPGHTWLQQDTQIYTPILEHLRDASVLAKDIIVERPHVAFTIYDETAVGLRAVTGLEFKTVLFAEQIATRTLGLWGIYLIATALGLELAPALFVALIWSLGASINGPAVLTVEYEPVPRAFAVPLLMLAIGLAAHGRWIWSGASTAIATLMHVPAVWPVLLVYMLSKQGRRALLLPLGAIAALLIAAKMQHGVTESQNFFTVLTPKLEMLQRMRASYNWLDLWWRDYLLQYLLLSAVCMAACWRFWNRLPSALRQFAIALPTIGLVSMPVSWLLQNHWKLALLPQLQPMRALLFVTAFASLLSAAAACLFAKRSQFLRALACFLVAWVLPMQARLSNPLSVGQWTVLLCSAALSCIVCNQLSRAWLAVPAYWAMASVVSFYPQLHIPQLRELSDWAKRSTTQDAVFLFADNGKANYPGVFRSEALRAVYVDWKGGGQVNYLREFAEDWWYRWQSVPSPDPNRYSQLGINYLVLNAGHEMLFPKVFQNSKYWVYKLE